MSKTVAFLGLGIMGTGMANRLLAAGFALNVYNRSAARTAAFESRARIAATPAEAVRDADFVVAIVSDDTASQALWQGETGALSGVKRGAVLVECSTLSPGWVRELAQAAQARGCDFIDAPVTGSKMQAAEGALKFLTGGTPEAIAAARPVFAAMGSEVIEMGPVGSGAVMKLANNYMCGVEVVALSEALAMAGRAGLDVAKVRAVLVNGAPGSPLVRTIAARQEAQDYAPNFFTNLMAKDLGYAFDEGRRLGLTLDMAVAARARFLAAAEAGYGEKDMSAVIEPLRK